MKRERRFFGAAAAIALTGAVAFACGSSSMPDAAVVGGGDGGGGLVADGSKDDAAVSDATTERFTAEVDASDAGACGVETICFEWQKGTASIHYRVHLPRVPAPQSTIVVHYGHKPIGGDSSGKYTLTHDYVDVYVRTNPGDFTVGLGVDNNGDGDDDDPGDFYGWFDGTVAAPNQNAATATVVTVLSSASVELGIGPRP